MAYQLIYWGSEGRGQAALRTTRLRSVEEAFSLSLPHQHPKGTVLVTLSRTDRQSVVKRILWKKDGYVDPCAITGEEDA